MSVYVDQKEYRRGRLIFCHMLADSLEELHAMADRIGVDRKHFQNQPGKTPHYDICKAKRKMAVGFGAEEIGFRKTVELIRMWRAKQEKAAQ